MTKKRKLNDGVSQVQQRSGENDASQPRLDPTYGQRSAFPGLDDPDDELQDEISLEAIAYLRSVRSEALTIPTLLLAPTEGNYGGVAHGNKDEDGRGYYEDGAYIAAPRNETMDGPQNTSLNSGLNDNREREVRNGRAMIDPRDAYHSSLIRRFHSTSSKLREQPPKNVATSLDPNTHATSLSSSPNRTEIAKWKRSLQFTTPRPAQIALMSGDTVIALLRILPSIMRRVSWASDGQDGVKGQQIGPWLWSLLGKIGDVGTLSSEEVSVIRDLGKRACQLTTGLSHEQLPEEAQDGSDEDNEENPREVTELEDGEANVQHEATCSDAEGTENEEKEEQGILDSTKALTNGKPCKVEDSCPKILESGSHIINDGSEAPSALDAAKEALMSRYVSSPAPATEGSPRAEYAMPEWGSRPPNQTQNMVATLDMVLTIVGECYGQRDLLSARDRLWNGDI